MTKKQHILMIFLSFIIISPLISQINIVCIGNSITKGDQTEFPYPTRLSLLLGNNYSVFNHGVNGSSVIKKVYPTYWHTQDYNFSTGENRDIVIILFGTNEAHPDNWYSFGQHFENDYNELIQEFNKYSNPNRQFILIIPPSILKTSTIGQTENYILRNNIIPQIKQIAQSTNSHIVDLYDTFSNHPEWYVDGIHPNADGHAYIAQLLYNKIIQETPPARPINLILTQHGDDINISWNRNIESDFLKNVIYRSQEISLLDNTKSVFTEVYPPNSEYGFTNYSTHPENYNYGIKAIESSGWASEMSDIVHFTPNGRPITGDSVLALLEDNIHMFQQNNLPFRDIDGDSVGIFKLTKFLNQQYFEYDSSHILFLNKIKDITKLLFNPDSNDFGNNYASMTYHITDSFGSTSLDTNTVFINVLPVNDEPSLDSIDDVYIMEDSHDILLPITGINTGASNEDQKLSIQVTTSDTSLIQVGEIHYVSPDTAGYVVINPIENVYGSRPVTIRVWDDGGTENGGIDYTDEFFYLYITPTNDPPSFDAIDNITIIEDTIITIDLTGINAGPWEFNQKISISVKSDNIDILPTPKLNYFSPNTSATLNFTTIPNVNGNTSITLIVSDDGGTEHGGQDSTSYTIPVEIVAVNDRPSDFSIVTPNADSTLVINKKNLNDTFKISWEPSEDIDGDKVFYNIIFNDELSELTRLGLESTDIEYNMKEVLAATDTVSIITESFEVIASDGNLNTKATNKNFTITVDGRLFAPARLNLDQNFPNPFNNSTLIGFDLPKRSKVSLTIFDILGKEIAKLIDNEYYERGYGTVTWNGLDANFVHVPAGIYFMQITISDDTQFKKLLLVK